MKVARRTSLFPPLAPLLNTLLLIGSVQSALQHVKHPLNPSLAPLNHFPSSLSLLSPSIFPPLSFASDKLRVSCNTLTAPTSTLSHRAPSLSTVPATSLPLPPLTLLVPPLHLPHKACFPPLIQHRQQSSSVLSDGSRGAVMGQFREAWKQLIPTATRAAGAKTGAREQ